MDVLITVPDDQGIDDLDEGIGDTPETVFEEFRPPTAKPPITDEMVVLLKFLLMTQEILG